MAPTDNIFPTNKCMMELLVNIPLEHNGEDDNEAVNELELLGSNEVEVEDELSSDEFSLYSGGGGSIEQLELLTDSDEDDEDDDADYQRLEMLDRMTVINREFFPISSDGEERYFHGATGGIRIRRRLFSDSFSSSDESD